VNARRTVVVLAAGEGKRMKSSVPKVLHPLLGRSLLGHVLIATGGVPEARTVVVIGNGADQVAAHLAEIAPKAETVLQADQLGTGHATRIALDSTGVTTGTVVVVNGDVPLLRAETIAELLHEHEAAGAAASVLTAEVPDPHGLGRIIRDPYTGGLAAIVEERDAAPDQLASREINAGVYAFDAAALRDALGKLGTHNSQGEEYLTDVIGLLVGAGRTVLAHPAADATEVLGCNDRAELATLRSLLRDRVNAEWMRYGVTLIDPATTWIDVTVTLGRDATIEPNTQLCGATAIADRALIGPDTTLIDVYVGEGAQVVRAHAAGARIGAGVQVGPYAYLRPGTVLHDEAKIGTFVEVKNSEVGAGSKVPHLSYVGDATIGEHSNIGAATVFVNYDGQAKHRTVIGSHARTGADNMFVAPVTVGDGAYTAAGSVIIRDVPPGALGVARGQQRNIEGWVARRRPGSAAAQAAARAEADPAVRAETVTHSDAATQAGSDPGGGEAGHAEPNRASGPVAPSDTASD
jgi:bifunctional UDP-N-acetylglucosamine pyrophosphorylase/glucosamine-1-phosphate N-acetyltransferase